MSSKNLIVVVGPTAIGKTKLGIVLAKHFKSEIISSDSRQFFKEMSIGTAVPTTSELEEAKHHFIQHISIHNTYSVGDFEKDALISLEQLFKTNDYAVMVGGSGLYTDAVVRGLDKFPEILPQVREDLNSRLRLNGIERLQQELRKKDPNYYQIVDLHNPQRIIRALEVCISSGKPFSSFLNKHKPNRFFNTTYVGINADREIIYERINSRVDVMMETGLLEEAKNLFKYRDLNALQTVGYRELFRYLEGQINLDFAISEIKKNTRRFAKRQLTWLKKNPEILWVNPEEEKAEIIEKIHKEINSKKNSNG